MAKINTYGLKMKGLREACSETRKIHGTGLVLQVAYDKADGRVLTAEHADCNSWTVWKSESVVNILSTTCRYTQQELADRIASHVNHRNIY